MNKRAGFTLLELSIVLVIIGLVVGGVLVGNDLIKSAKLQKVIRESQSYQNSVAAFRLKYNALPGDMANPDEFFPDAVWNMAATGKGNNIILAITEGADAWRQLMLANMIPAGGMLGHEGCTRVNTETCNAAFGSTRVRSAFSDKAGWVLGYSTKTSKNVVLFGGAGEINNAPSYTDRAILSSLGAYSIDSKVDDGMPYTGSVRHEGGYATFNYQADSTRNTFRCTDADDGVLTKNSGNDMPDYFKYEGDPACSLSFPLNM